MKSNLCATFCLHLCSLCVQMDSQEMSQVTPLHYDLVFMLVLPCSAIVLLVQYNVPLLIQSHTHARTHTHTDLLFISTEAVKPSPCKENTHKLIHTTNT